MGITYFASDFHLGIDTEYTSIQREKAVVRWLEEIKQDAESIYLLGDIFDLWFEYKKVVPKGYTRLLGKLAELTDSGIKVVWLTGNHDMWTFGYLEDEVGVFISKNPFVVSIGNSKFYLSHGDGLGEGDYKYKLIKKILSNPLCQFLFGLIPSRLGLFLMRSSSDTSRFSQKQDEEYEMYKDGRLVHHSQNILKTNKIDYFIYGHRHRPKIVDLEGTNSKYVNLGDWTKHFTYAVYDGKEFKLKAYPKPK